MGKKNRQPSKPAEPKEEQPEEGSEEESTEASESEPETVPLQSAENRPKGDSSEEDEDDLDSESGSESDVPEEKVKLEAVKPVEIASPRKSKSKPDSDPSPAAKSKALKRPLGDDKETEAKDSKRPKAKPKPEVQTSEKKQQQQQQHRLWSEEDEVVILRGLIDYAAKKKADPAADMNAFHELIKKKIHVDATRAQVQDKVRKLKSKYLNKKNKEIDGKNVTFAKPHEEEVYELSKKIWGGESKVGTNGGSSSSARNAASKKIADAEAAKEVKAENGRNENVRKVETVDAEAAKEVKAEKDKDKNMRKAEVGKRANVPRTLEERVMSIGAEAFEGGSGVERADEWRSLTVREVECYLAQLEVKKSQAKMVLDYLKSA